MAKLLSADNEFKPWFDWFKWHYLQQREFIDAINDYWEIVFIGGNGTGKTHILYWNVAGLVLGLHPAQRLIGNPPISVKVLVNSFEQGMEQIARHKLFRPTPIHAGTVMADGTMLKENIEIGPIMPKSMVERMWNKEDRTLYLKNGSTIHFQTSEQRKKLHSGTTFDILACDEEPEYGPYDESRRGLRNAKGGGRILHAFTPPFMEGQGPSWTKEKLIDLFDEGLGEEKSEGMDLKDLFLVQASMSDNPAITEDYARKWMKGKSEQEIAIQFYGQYPSWGKLVHQEFQDRIWDPSKKEGNLLPEDWQVPFGDPDYSFEMAVDWHQSKACAAIWTCEDRDGNVYVWEEMKPYEEGLTIKEISEVFREIEGAPHRDLRVRRYIDPKSKDRNNAMVTGMNAWDLFRQNGIRFTEGYNRDPEAGISIVNDYIRGNTKDHPRLFVRENCTTLRRAMRNHYWKKHGDVYKPDPKWSDYPICLRYILQRKQKQTGIRRRAGHYDMYKGKLNTYDGMKNSDPYVTYRRNPYA